MIRRLALFGLFVIASCTDPSEPSTLSATFDLISVDGLPLPATPPPSLGAVGMTLVSGTLTLDRLGNAIFTEDRADQAGPITVRYNYLYRVDRANIQFLEQLPCPTGAFCTMPPTGEIVDNTIRVRIMFPTKTPFQVYDYQSVFRQ